MTSITIFANLGTVALEKLVKKILVALHLDKNGDGKVTKAEIFAAIAELAPELFNFENILAEGRDLTASEFQHLCNVAAANMPDYPNVRAEAETLISAVLEAVGAVGKVVIAVRHLSATRPEVPATPAVPAEVETEPTVPVSPAKSEPTDNLQAKKDKTSGEVKA